MLRIATFLLLFSHSLFACASLIVELVGSPELPKDFSTAFSYGVQDIESVSKDGVAVTLIQVRVEALFLIYIQDDFKKEGTGRHILVPPRSRETRVKPPWQNAGRGIGESLLVHGLKTACFRIGSRCMLGPLGLALNFYDALKLVKFTGELADYIEAKPQVVRDRAEERNDIAQSVFQLCESGTCSDDPRHIVVFTTHELSGISWRFEE